ncbi:FUSC family protein [Streptomyces olivoreticuli]|uniref:FUSC family protein n=1 Tax=Streptomyces olivoreticuli TaxID=68246 RepID=UPI0026596C9C|nr:FUSC family protein [Streptomyces olivoreticuli]WKK24374.1 FUSC family protein [Streptomyces olivoreticuli]
MALSVVLVALPLPTAAGRGERAWILLARTACLTSAGIYVWLIGPHTWLLVAGVTVAAAAGALAPRIGAIAPLAVLMVGITGSGASPAVPGLEQLAGGLWTSSLLLPRWGRPRADPPAPAAVPAPPRRRHAARLAVLVGAVSSLLTLGGRLGGDMHWLVTSVLLTTQPTPEATRTKGVKRVLGNTVGGIATALILITQPRPTAVAATVALAGAAAYCWRPANYFYWTLAAPLLLLLLGDYDQPVPWYAAAVRVGLNILGGALALTAARWLWPTHPRRTAPPAESGTRPP